MSFHEGESIDGYICLGKTIGKGEFSKVIKCSKDNIEYAAKIFKMNDKAYLSYLKEYNIYKKLEHPYIVKIHHCKVYKSEIENSSK